MEFHIVNSLYIIGGLSHKLKLTKVLTIKTETPEISMKRSALTYLLLPAIVLGQGLNDLCHDGTVKTS